MTEREELVPPAAADGLSAWTLAKRSRSVVLALGFLALGLLLFGIATKDLLAGERGARWLAGFGLFLLVLGGLLALAGWRRAKRQLRIAREGIETRATVTAVRRARLQPGGSRLTLSTRRGTQIIRYSYLDDFGRAHKGKSGYLPFEQASGWKAGDAASVRYDPENSRESVWMGRGGAT